MLATHFELFSDLVQVANLRMPAPKNLNVCILVAGGGIGVEFTDVFETAGFNVVDLQEDTKEALAQIFPPVNTNFKNPDRSWGIGISARSFCQSSGNYLKR